MHQSYIYDIRTSADALGTLVNFTKVIPPIWERYISRIRDYQYTEDLVEDVIRTHGCFPDNYEKWIFTYFHITTSANGCASFRKHGLLDLKNSYPLNDFYSTNIFSIFSVAKHILALNIDEKLKSGDSSIVNEIAKVKINDKEKNFYSFATKYCSHHFPKEFPIYDSFVEKVLIYYKKCDNFMDFKKEDLKDYKLFKNILLVFKKFYDIDEYSLKDIDRFLWQLGKEYFPQKY